MKKKIKVFILPIILTISFIIIYLFIYPEYKSKEAIKTIFNDFENGLNNLNIVYQKQEIDSKEFGEIKAYSYVSDEKIVKIYVYPKKSKKFKEGTKLGYITDDKNEESKLYGIFLNNCVLFLEKDYPNSDQIISLFTALSKEYIDSL